VRGSHRSLTRPWMRRWKSWPARRRTQEWSTAALEAVATAMQAANRRSAQIERAVIDAVECVLLFPHVGERFEAVVVDRNEHGAIIQLTRPAVVEAMASDAALGDHITVRLESVDPVSRRLQFRAVSG
jgi:exoribonuclease R